ncbi:uncharacterized protein G2W53_023616 [Senna tora]|uniref:Uncharacterized protein n=1 Tax=Senna tora TaxID=362788 RepID=A0A834TBS3_9FABA|nr:uncharacterized protein G2W53_023616 [Senna tora]
MDVQFQSEKSCRDCHTIPRPLYGGMVQMGQGKLSPGIYGGVENETKGGPAVHMQGRSQLMPQLSLAV